MPPSKALGAVSLPLFVLIVSGHHFERLEGLALRPYASWQEDSTASKIDRSLAPLERRGSRDGFGAGVHPR